MAVTALALFQAKQAENAETVQYTSTGMKTIIDKLTGTNTSGSAAATLTVKLVPSGGSAGVSNQIVSKTLQPGECYTFPEVVGHVLSAGDTISTIASAATTITIRASGRTVS